MQLTGRSAYAMQAACAPFEQAGISQLLLARGPAEPAP